MVSPYLEADCVRRGRWTALRLSTPQSPFNTCTACTQSLRSQSYIFTRSDGQYHIRGKSLLMVKFLCMRVPWYATYGRGIFSSVNMCEYKLVA
jgi:hypothetical protein